MNGKGQSSGRFGAGARLRSWRWQLRRRVTAWQYGRSALGKSPIIFGNSFPKSGTHLLAQILTAFPRIGLAVDRGMGPILTYRRSTGERRSSASILADLNRLGPGDVGFGHLIADPAILDGFCRQDVLQFFVRRDPRDVVVSHALYIGERATHNVHHEFYKALSDPDERIRYSILGRPDWEEAFPDIRARYELYLGWLDCPGVCQLRFEDLIEDRPGTLRAILAEALSRGFQLHLPEKEALEILQAAVDPGRSYTYRKGRVGDWQEHFSPENKGLFKEISGDLLIRLDYEESNDW